MAAFTPDAAASLGGPDWLRARRVAAAERFAALDGLPTASEEVWRYSRIGELDLDAYRPAVDGVVPAGVPDDIRRMAAVVGPTAALVVEANGALTHVEVAPD